MRTDCDYYYKRAEAELEMAQRFTVPEAVKAHYMLAGYYLDHVYANGVGEHSQLTQLLAASR